MATRAATPSDFWRLAEQAERLGVKILVEPLSQDHFSSSASDPGKLYRVTGFSCTCQGFFHHQRCMHHALLLKHLGWLPDDPEPSAPAAGLAHPVEVACPLCAADEPRSTRRPTSDRCPACDGRGTVEAWTNDANASSSSPNDVRKRPIEAATRPAPAGWAEDESDDDALAA